MLRVVLCCWISPLCLNGVTKSGKLLLFWFGLFTKITKLYNFLRDVTSRYVKKFIVPSVLISRTSIHYNISWCIRSTTICPYWCSYGWPLHRPESSALMSNITLRFCATASCNISSSVGIVWLEYSFLFVSDNDNTVPNGSSYQNSHHIRSVCI